MREAKLALEVKANLSINATIKWTAQATAAEVSTAAVRPAEET